MKLINTLYLAIALLIAGLTWKVLDPYLSRQNGTSVISLSPDNKKGGGVNIIIPSGLSRTQLEILNFAYEVAKADGFKEPKYLQGILMQESRAGGMDEFRVAGIQNAPGNRYFGIGQIKLVAAKAVMQRYPEMWKFLDTRTDEELQARLILDDKFNIRVASKYALIMGINHDPVKAITAYNVGPGAVLTHPDPSSHHYTVKVKKHADNVKSATKRLQSDGSTRVAWLDFTR
jgi:hypothetical protein